MTANTGDYVEFVMGQLQTIGSIKKGRFFGGVGLSYRTTQFAMMMGNTLYFAVNEQSRPRYQQMGSKCFSYATSRGRVNVEKYYEVPADMIEDDDALLALARESIEAATKKPTRTAPLR